MQDILRMQCINPKSNLNKELPDHVLAEILSQLRYITAQVSVLAVLHYDVD